MTDVTISVTRDTRHSTETLPAGTTYATLFAGDRAVIAVRVDGRLCDLDTPVTDGDTAEPVAVGSPDGLDILRHSTAHVMAQAVQELFPEAKLGIGPPVKD
ncbi:threonine--tRNA ligase, partial [Streptomyces sp. NPDC049577]